MVKSGVRVVLDIKGSYMEKDGKRIPLEMIRNTFYLPAIASATEADGKENIKPEISEARSSDDPKGSTHAGLDTPKTTRSLTGLAAWSSVGDLKARLKDLGAPSYGDKSVLWTRVLEYEKRA